MSHDHYFIDVSAYERVDVYRLIELLGITCPVAQHVFKKAAATGKRGHKSARRDWQDIADSATRRLQMMDEDDRAEQRKEVGRKLADGVRKVAGGAVCSDPRTVVGVDVSFDTEKHLSFAPTQCADCGFPVRGLPEAHCKHHYASASNE